MNLCAEALRRRHPSTISQLTALKETITKQSHIIESFRGDLTKVKDQNVKLGEEVKSLRAHLDAYSVPPPTTRTWVTVTASSKGTCQSSGSTPPNNKSPEAPAKEAHCVRINTKPRDTQTDTENLTFTRYLPTESANAQIRNALLNADATKYVQVTGVLYWDPYCMPRPPKSASLPIRLF